MDWEIEKIPKLEGYTIEYAEPENFYLSRQNQLFHSKTIEPPFSKIATIEAPFWKAAAGKFRLAQRLLRFMVSNVVPLETGDIFVTFDKSVGIIRKGKYKVLKGLQRPCRVLRSACTVDGSGNVYFGEYLANRERGVMRIYRYREGSDSLEVVKTFPPDSIKHIHGLYFDRHTDSIFCLTGDVEKECQILRSFDGFKTTETVGAGDETWRAVSVLFDKNSFFYGTDAEFRTNQIIRVDRKSLEREDLCEVNGTVFYSKKLDEDLFFTTTAENAPSQKENVAAIWQIDKLGQGRELIKFKKDIWHKTLFMFGTIHFPGINKFTDRLYFHLVGVKNDNQTFCLKKPN